MIPLFPYWRFIIHTSLSREEALARLSDAVAPLKFHLFRVWDTRPQPFTGTVSEDGFQIRRIIHYRNSFLPQIYGCFLPSEEGVQIRIVMRLHPFALAIGVFLLLGIVPVLTSVLYQVVVTGHFEGSFKKPLLLIAFLYFMFAGGFCYEAVIARRLLNRLFTSPAEKPVW